jgi:ribose transport system substrate-binding protein
MNVGLQWPDAVDHANAMAYEAGQLGVKFMVMDSHGDVNKQADNAKDAISLHPNGVILSVMDPVASEKVIDQLVAAGINVMTFHLQVGNDPPPVVYPGIELYLGEDEVKTGCNTADLLMKYYPNGAKVAIVSGPAGFAEVGKRKSCFIDKLNATNGKYSILGDQPGDWLADSGKTICANILTAHPDIDVFYSEGDDMANGCLKGIQAAGSSAKIIGLGGQPVGLKMIADGTMLASSCYDHYMGGIAVMKDMYAQLKGEANFTGVFMTYSTPMITKDGAFGTVKASDCRANRPGASAAPFLTLAPGA